MTICKHETFLNACGREVWDVGTAVYHSRVHSINGPTGSALEALKEMIPL